MAKPRTLLAHSDRAFLDRLARVLAPEFEIIGTLDDVRLLPGYVRRMRPDVIVQSLSDSPHVRPEILEKIPQIASDSCVVLVTPTVDERMIANAFERRFSAVILQSSSDQDFLDGIRAAYARRK
jgi:DNA-binding NarL/FixJ family response regulator